MLFQPHLCRQILTRRKTQTRRLVKPGAAGAQPRCFYRVGSSYRLERPMRLDEANELQAAIILGRRRGRPPKKEIGRLNITAVERGPLGDIDFAAARAEGFENPTAFKTYWVRLHDLRWIRRRERRPVVGIGPALEPLSDDELAERFADRWAASEVWTISFQVEAATLYLAERSDRGGADYVTSERDEQGRQVAMTHLVDVENASPEAAPPGVPTWSHGELLRVPEEAVHPDIIDAWERDPASTHQKIKTKVRHSGHTTSAHQRALDRRLLEAEDRIRERVRLAKAQARTSGVNVAAQIKALRIAQERKRTPEHIEGLLHTLERAGDRQEDTVDAA